MTWNFQYMTACIGFLFSWPMSLKDLRQFSFVSFDVWILTSVTIFIISILTSIFRYIMPSDAERSKFDHRARKRIREVKKKARPGNLFNFQINVVHNLKIGICIANSLLKIINPVIRFVLHTLYSLLFILGYCYVMLYNY